MLFIVSASMFADVRTIEIKTNPLCENCKNRIEKFAKEVKGVLKVNMNMKTKNVSVMFDGVKTNPLRIKKYLARNGYDADKIKANNKARKNIKILCKEKK